MGGYGCRLSESVNEIWHMKWLAFGLSKEAFGQTMQIW